MHARTAWILNIILFKRTGILIKFKFLFFFFFVQSREVHSLKRMNKWLAFHFTIFLLQLLLTMN
jgi:hypothetical protein